MKPAYRRRRVGVMIISLITLVLTLWQTPELWQQTSEPQQQPPSSAPPPAQVADGTALALLEELPVKGRAPKTDYRRDQFGSGWATTMGCDTRNIILKRDLIDTSTNEKCQIVSGVLNDPYTGNVITFSRGETSSQAVQIDHVVALSNAWQTGAQQLSPERRTAFANDALNLLAVDGDANQEKSDADAATWLPPNKAFRCQYVARQVAVKHAYDLWVTMAEKQAIQRVLQTCPDQQVPSR